MSRLLVGVFETPWTADAALDEAYRRDDLKVITSNLWAPMRFSARHQNSSQELSVRGAFTPNGLSVPVSRTVLVTLRDGSALAVEKLIIQKKEGAQVFGFPLAKNLRVHGLPTLESFVAR